jgi:hypothetical protein
MGVSYMVIRYIIRRCCIFDDQAVLPLLSNLHMKNLKYLYLVLVFGLLVISVVPVKAQCAMCAATVESGSKNGSTKADGLNNGIMYLAVAVVGYIWYKKYRRKDVDLNIRPEKLNLN